MATFETSGLANTGNHAESYNIHRNTNVIPVNSNCSKQRKNKNGYIVSVLVTYY